MAVSKQQGDQQTNARWTPRVWSGRALQFLAVAAPLTISLLAAWLLGSHVPTPSTWPVAIGRWIGIALMSTIVLFFADRAFRRLLPLASLLKLTLSFPDVAPSRFKLAMRTGTTKQLQQRIDDARAGRFGDTPAEAAELVLELVAALSIHDRLTRGHSERVRAYTQMIGKELGMSGVELDRLRWAALLHDIGKVMIPTEILNKPGKLTNDEYEIIKLHPEYGQKMIAPLTPWLGEAAHAVWEHHERWEGGGYPRGIAGTEITHVARIVSVADTYDVITSVRSYKQRTSAKDARAELARCAGTQFDPAVVRAFLNISVFPVGRVTAPASWATQLAMFPATVFSSAARGIFAVSVALGASTAALGVAGAVPVPGLHNDDGDRSPDEASDREEGQDAGAEPVALATPAPGPSAVATDATGGADPDSGSVDRTSDEADTFGPPIPATAATNDPTTAGGPPPATDPGDASSPSVTNPPILPIATNPAGAGPNVGLPIVPGPDGTPIIPPPATTPNLTVPPLTVPTVTVPPVTVPPVQLPPNLELPPVLPILPSVTVPPITVPPITLPPVTLPPVTGPNVDLPPVTVPPVTVPPVAVPPVTVPSVTVPSVTVPSVTVPSVTVPSVTVPSVTVPPVTVPLVTVPPVTVPPVTVPPVTVPATTLPPPPTTLEPVTVTTTTPPAPPPVTVPPTTLPPTTLPPTTLPPTTLPPTTLPPVTVPSTTLPPPTLPPVTIPPPGGLL